MKSIWNASVSSGVLKTNFFIMYAISDEALYATRSAGAEAYPLGVNSPVHHDCPFSGQRLFAKTRSTKSDQQGPIRPGPVQTHNLDDAGMSFDWRPASALDKQSVKGDRPTAPSRQSCSNQLCLAP
jgi:hypothetical protein